MFSSGFLFTFELVGGEWFVKGKLQIGGRWGLCEGYGWRGDKNA